MAVAQKKPAPGARAPVKPPVRIAFRKEDTVKVISGRDKGKTGRVLRVDRATGRILVEHIMMIKRHTRPNPSRQIKGGIAERESPIAASNVMLVCPGCGKTTRIGRHVDVVAGGKARRTRVCLKCGQTLDRK
jgi:large subunit ribosomal protein L24